MKPKKQATISARQKILDFITDNPGCIRPDIVAYLNENENVLLNSYLNRMRDAGMISGDKVPGERYIKWFPKDGEDVKLPPRKHPRMGWMGEHGRDVLVAALFGAPHALNGVQP